MKINKFCGSACGKTAGAMKFVTFTFIKTTGGG